MHQALINTPIIRELEGLYLNTTENPLSKKTLHELFLFSTIIVIVSALLLQFLMNLQTAILLRHYSISFTYSLFNIHFSSVSETKWTSEMIYIVYGIGLSVYFVAGILLLQVKVNNWKARLILTWLAFLMIHTLPFGLLAGIYFYDGLAIAYTWMIPDVVIRVVIALVVLLIAVFCRSYWIYRFLKTAFSRAYLDDESYRTKYIKYCFVLPWIAGATIISAFAFPHHTWVWFVFIIGLGLVVLPRFRRAIPVYTILIHKSEKKILSFRSPLLYFITVIVVSVIWLISLIRISF